MKVPVLNSALFRRYNDLRLCTAVLLVAAILPIWVAFRCGHSLMDDAYITLTYAKSLAAGRGFVFNHPPATLGTTTPLLTCLVALGTWASGFSEESVAVAITALCWIGVAWIFLCFRTAYGLRPWQATLVGLMFIGSARVILGHEYYLFQFLLYLSLGLYLSQKHFACGVACGLLFLTRGEGILLAPILAAFEAGQSVLSKDRNRRSTLRACAAVAGGFALPFLGWSAYAVKTFGRILPDTLDAKMIQGRIDVPYDTFGEALFGWIARWWYWEQPALLYVRPFFWLAVLVGLLYVVRRNRKWLPLIAWCALYTLGYAILGVQAYWWYQLPLYFLAFILVGLGLSAIIEWGARRLPRKWPLALCLAAAAMAISLQMALTTYKALAYAGDHRAPSYRALCTWLNENTKPGDTVAFGEVGYLGYYTDNAIIDLWGIVSPEVLPHLKENDHAWAVLELKPQYYIETGAPQYETLLNNPEFQEKYLETALIEGTPPREKCRIFRRKSPLLQTQDDLGIMRHQP